MGELNFLKKTEKFELKQNNKIYRGAIPWILLTSKNKKIIYISTSNRNLENYHYMLENYLEEKKSKKYSNKKIEIFENISSKKEDMTGINIKLLDILKNQSEFVLFINLQITLDVFFEKVKFLDFKIGKEYEITKTINFLIENGYENSYLIDKKGQYSKRGDILDIFPPDLENPIRLEFFGDELDSIREFDIDSQKSISKINEIKIFGNALSGKNYELVELIEELQSEDVVIIIENEELLDYKMEEYILLNREKENIYRQRYENLKNKSFSMETVNFTEEQLETFKTKDKLEKLSEIKKVELYTKNYDKKVSEYIREYLVELRRINGIDIPVPEVTEKALKWAKARTDEMAKNNELSHDTVLKASDFSLKHETENASQGALPEKSILNEKQIAYTELLQYFNDYSNASGYGAENPNGVNIYNYGHRIPLLAASGTGFAVSATKGFGILTFVSDNDKRIYGTLPSEINPSERGSYTFNGKKYYYNPGSSYDLARAENKDGDKDRSEFYYNGKRVKFLPKTTFRYVWNETVRHRNLKRDEALNKLNEFNKKQLELEKNQTKKLNRLNEDLMENKNILSKSEKDLNQSKELVEKLTKQNTQKFQEITRLTKELDKKIGELKEVQEIQNKEEAKLVALKNKLSGEKNKLEQERKDLDSTIQKLLETKKYKLSLENASENLKKIEEEVKHLEKEYSDEKNILLLENDKLLKIKEKLDIAHKCYEDLRNELEKFKKISPEVPGDQNPGGKLGENPEDKAPGSSDNQPDIQRPSVNTNGLNTLPNTGESQTGIATVAGLVALAVAARLRKNKENN